MNTFIQFFITAIVGGLVMGVDSIGSTPIQPIQQKQPPAVRSLQPGEPQQSTLSLPGEYNIPIPFYPQAPYDNWTLPWQEACEEASTLLIANAYFEHQWTREQFKNEILKLVEWEKKRFGKHLDTNAAETAEILNDYLNLKTVIHENPSLEEVKKILAKGHPIIMFFAGKQLGNSNYRNGGPVYHVIVVKGYKTNNKIITHDVGTRYGADYLYDWSTIQNAMHDLAYPIENGAKKMIEVLPPSW